MIPPERKRTCPKTGHLVEFPPQGEIPASSWAAPKFRHPAGMGLVVDTIGISLHILTNDGTIIQGVRRTTVEVIG